MYKHQPLDPKPVKVQIVFQLPVHLHTSFLEGTKQDVETVKKITINDPLVFTYHTYGKGTVSYYAEWFSKNTRPLKKYIIQFDTLDIISMKIENKEYSINR
jgi:hypothetical protein